MPVEKTPAVDPPVTECPGCAAALSLLHEASAALARPMLIGIGGPGGSGKSSFSAAIARLLDDVRILPLDDYRKPRSERSLGIYGSHPAGNRLDLLKKHLEDAKNARPFDRPVFCRVRGAAIKTQSIQPARFIIADGEIAAHRDLRELFDFRILVLADWSLQWQARFGRDRTERASSLRKALTLFFLSNLRDYPRFSSGASTQADLILRRTRCGKLHPQPRG